MDTKILKEKSPIKIPKRASDKNTMKINRNQIK